MDPSVFVHSSCIHVLSVLLSSDQSKNADAFQIKPALQGIAMATVFGTALLMTAFARPDAEEISFQTFKTDLLAKQFVERVEVVNKSLVKVYTKASNLKKDDTRQSKHVSFQLLLSIDIVCLLSQLKCCSMTRRRR